MGSAAAPDGYGMGGASFTLGIDDSSFNKKLIEAEQQASRSSQKIAGSISAGGTNAAHGLLALANAIDDAQYGFRGIVNNIPQVIQMLGMGAGMAGVAGIAAVAVNQLLNHWDDLAKLWRSDFAVTQAEAMAQVADNTARAAKEAEKLLAIQTSYQSASAAATNAAIAGQGGSIVEGLRNSLRGKVPNVQARNWAFGGQMMSYGPGSQLYEDALRQKALEMFGGINDPNVRRQIADLVAKNPGNFPPGFGTTLENTSPVAKIESKLADDKAKAFGDERRADDELNKAKKEQADRIRARIQEELNLKASGLEAQKQALEKQREAIQEAQHNRPHYGTFGGVGELIRSMTEERFNRIPTQQLTELKNIKTGIDKLNDQIKNVRGARFG